MVADKIRSDLSLALKNKESLKVSTLRLLLSVIQNKEKEKRYKVSSETDVFLDDQEIIEIINSEVKKRRESIKSFKAGKRDDLAEKESQELEILQDYLPEEISEDEIEKIIKEAIEKTKAEGLKDIGKVMGEVMPKTKGRADGLLVSSKVKEMLS